MTPNFSHPVFYKLIRPLFPDGFKQVQVDSINDLLAAGSVQTDGFEQLAYVFATVYHETGRTMLPVEEGGRGRGRSYGKKLDLVGNRLVAYEEPDELYYGRGYCQLTWRSNYLRMGVLVGEDLLNYPERALHTDIAARILFTGMTRGSFTGRRLKDYFYVAGNRTVADPVNARRIVNGLDCARAIAGYYAVFLTALQK